MVVLDSKKSDTLRCNYIKNFVDTVSAYYKENIESKTMFSDRLCYTGYLWDCLQNPSIISECEADKFLSGKQKIFIMWDIHSCERIFIPDYWKFPKTKLLYTDTWVETYKASLPEDVYVFDDTLSWSVIYTHETDANNNRYCLLLDKDFQNISNKFVHA